MKKLITIIMAPLLSLFIFMLGSGLFTTLLSVRLHHEGASALLIGFMTGSYYAGLAYGSFKIERFILRVGHIRAFAAFASFLSVFSLVQGLFVSPWAWLIIRFLGGFATAGVFVVIESWLLSVGSTKIRGQILALYMIALYAAQALGQFLLNFSSTQTLTLFAVTAMLSSLAVIPICLTKNPSPELSEPSSLNIKKLFEASASGLSSSFCSGLILGAIYGLLPLVIMQKTSDTSQVGMLMALVIFGGMFLQFPVGKLSDIVERRLILLGLSLLTIVASVLMMSNFHLLYIKYLTFFALGGMTFTLYPVSISHACDGLDQKDIVSGTQGILLAYSVGATIGPFIAPFFMRVLGTNGLFIYLMSVCIILAAILVWRKASVASTPQDESFMVMPQTTPVTAELDPRGENSS